MSDHSINQGRILRNLVRLLEVTCDHSFYEVLPRGVKLWLPEPRVEQFYRAEEHLWGMTIQSGFDTVIDLAVVVSIQISSSLSGVEGNGRKPVVWLASTPLSQQSTGSVPCNLPSRVLRRKPWCVLESPFILLPFCIRGPAALGGQSRDRPLVIL